MEWPDSLADSLPAPRDDEPESLRQDIADELADHLQCSVDRHLLSHPDLAAARAKAIQRFGDPRRIARQLWFDALKERIMSQRILLAAVAVMMLAFVAVAAVAWRALDTGRKAIADLVAQNQASAEALRKANDAMLARMERLSDVRDAPPSFEWSSVKLRLTVAEGRKLPNGYGANLSGNLLEPGKSINVRGEVDAEGAVDFGLVRTGQHSLNLWSPFGDHYNRTITVLPGRKIDDVVECPAERPPQVDVAIAVDWPDDLKERGYWAVGAFVPIARTRDETGRGWWSIGAPSGVAHVIVIDPKGLAKTLEPAVRGEQTLIPDWLSPSAFLRHVSHEDVARLQLLNPPISNRSYGEAIDRPNSAPAKYAPGLRVEKEVEQTDAEARERWAFAFLPNDFDADVRLHGIGYRLVGLFVLRPPETRSKEALRKSTVVAAIAWPYGEESALAKMIYPPSSEPVEQSSPPELRFKTQPSAANVWKIQLPEEFATILRSAPP